MKTKAFCWWCQRQLQGGKKGGGYHAKLVKNIVDGRVHRVHKTCFDYEMAPHGWREYVEEEGDA